MGPNSWSERGGASQTFQKPPARQRIGLGLKLHFHEEADVYRALELDYIEPEMRENTGEIELSAKGHLPKLESTEEVNAEAECRVVTGSRLCRRPDANEEAGRSHGAEFITVR